MEHMRALGFKSKSFKSSLMPLTTLCRESSYKGQCCVLCLVTQSCPTLCNTMDCSPPGSSVHGDSPSTGVHCCVLLQGNLPDPGTEPRSPALQVDSLPSEPPGKPINAGVGSLSLLQGIFPTQELNWGILHCRWILFQLSYQGGPIMYKEEQVLSAVSMQEKKNQL